MRVPSEVTASTSGLSSMPSLLSFEGASHHGSSKENKQTSPTKNKPRTKSKMEKIFQLQASNKALKVDNKTVRNELRELNKRLAAMERALYKVAGSDTESLIETASRQSSHKHSRRASNESQASMKTEERMKTAMRALQSVTVTQEKKLHNLRSTLEESKYELNDKSNEIESLKNECVALKATLEEDTEKSAVYSSVQELRDVLESKVKHITQLEVKAKESNTHNKMIKMQLANSEAKGDTLKSQLQRAQNQLEKASNNDSSQSLSNLSESRDLSEKDINRLRHDLITKIEKIVLLEFELEMSKDEIEDLKEALRRQDEDNFPRDVDEDDFFSHDQFDDDDDDECNWP
eukprot:scaffold483837_cov59-Attheya_sp.AAC.2